MSRILVIASYSPSLILFRGDLLQAFVDRGHEVVCCSPDPDEETLARLAEMGIGHHSYRLRRAGISPITDLATLRDLEETIRQEKPDHVLSYTIKPVIFGSMAARRANVPNIHAMITGLGTAFLASGIRGRLLNLVVRTLYRKALGSCRTVFFQNPDDRELFLDLGLVAPGQVQLTHGSGIHLERFAEQPVPAGPVTFLLIARLIREKGVVVFVEAARRVKAYFPGAVFRIVGYFDDHPRALRPVQVDRWVKEGLVEYPGPSDDVRPHLRDCSVYCLPSTHREGTPRTVLEAMATGRAIVTTDVPGCRETVTDGWNGALVPPGDADALAAAMLRYCEEPQLAIEHGRCSRELAVSKYDVQAVNRVVLDAMGLEPSSD